MSEYVNVKIFAMAVLFEIQGLSLNFQDIKLIFHKETQHKAPPKSPLKIQAPHPLNKLNCTCCTTSFPEKTLQSNFHYNFSFISKILIKNENSPKKQETI
jgi:hypothetical protein